MTQQEKDLIAFLLREHAYKHKGFADFGDDNPDSLFSQRGARARVQVALAEKALATIDAMPVEKERE